MESWLTASGTPEEMEARQPLESCMQVLEPQRARELFLQMLRATLARHELGRSPAGARERPGWRWWRGMASHGVHAAPLNLAKFQVATPCCCPPVCCPNRWREEESSGMGCLLTTLPALVNDSSEPEGGLPPGSRSIACLELTGALDELLMDAWDKDARSTFNGGCGVGSRHAAWYDALGMA